MLSAQSLARNQIPDGVGPSPVVELYSQITRGGTPAASTHNKCVLETNSFDQDNLVQCPANIDKGGKQIEDIR